MSSANRDRAWSNANLVCHFPGFLIYGLYGFRNSSERSASRAKKMQLLETTTSGDRVLL